MADEVEVLSEPSEEVEAKIKGLFNRTILRKNPLGKSIRSASKWQFWTLDRQRFIATEKHLDFRPRGYTFFRDRAAELEPKNWTVTIRKYRNRSGYFRWRTEAEHTLMCVSADSSQEVFSRLAAYLRVIVFSSHIRQEILSGAR